MRRTAHVIAAVTLVVVASSPAFAQKQVTLLATIADPSGGEVTTIDPKDVVVAENGQALSVSKVEAMQTVPKVQVLIDDGVGMPSESIGDLRKALQGLIEAIPPGVETTIVTTGGQPKFLQKATTDHAALVAAIGKLSPEAGAGHFVDSLSEAVDRIDKDKADAHWIIVTIATNSGDGDARDTDVNKIVKRVSARGTTVYAVVYNKIGSSVSGGAIQQDLGQSIGPGSGGRFENINLTSRLITLLPEIATQMANAMKPGAKQFRITADRSSTAPLGGLTLSVTGKAASNVRIERKQ